MIMENVIFGQYQFPLYPGVKITSLQKNFDGSTVIGIASESINIFPPDENKRSVISIELIKRKISSEGEKTYFSL
jgi:hypothetical protein